MNRNIRIKTGESRGNDCVFLWLYCKNYKTYKDYSKEKTAPAILCQFRHDGSFGAIGGKVDKNEELKEALFREVKEESGISFSADDKNSIKQISSHYFKGNSKDWTIHAFGLEVNPERLEYHRMQSTQHITMKNNGEVNGYNIIPLSRYDVNKINNTCNGLETFLKNQFNSSAKLEIEILLEEIMK